MNRESFLQLDQELQSKFFLSGRVMQGYIEEIYGAIIEAYVIGYNEGGGKEQLSEEELKAIKAEILEKYLEAL